MVFKYHVLFYFAAFLFFVIEFACFFFIASRCFIALINKTDFFGFPFRFIIGDYFQWTKIKTHQIIKTTIFTAFFRYQHDCCISNLCSVVLVIEFCIMPLKFKMLPSPKYSSSSTPSNSSSRIINPRPLRLFKILLVFLIANPVNRDK